MLGLSRTSGFAASLLLNLEGVFTLAIAWIVFRENVDRRIALGAAGDYPFRAKKAEAALTGRPLDEARVDRVGVGVARNEIRLNEHFLLRWGLAFHGLLHVVVAGAQYRYRKYFSCGGGLQLDAIGRSNGCRKAD